MNSYKLAERAVLMRLSIGCPGEQRQDPELTSDVKSEHKLGAQSGRWIKSLYPPEALKGIKKLDNEARAYHAAVTLPFDQGIGILPAALIVEYGDRIRHFKGMRDNLVENEFLKDPEKWIQWAIASHNGTFDPEQYPGCHKVSYSATPRSVTARLLGHDYEFDAEEFRAVMREKFSFRCEPIPVPDAAHFEGTLSSLLGVDAEGVNVRVQDAMQEGMRELMKRLIEPVKAMAAKLSEEPKQGKEDVIFRDSLIGNVKEIAELAPKLNISGDPQIDQFAREMAGLANYTPDKLRKDKLTRAEAAKAASAVLEKLSGYKL